MTKKCGEPCADLGDSLKEMRIADREMRDLLLDAVFVQTKILLLKPPHETIDGIGDGDGNLHQRCFHAQSSSGIGRRRSLLWSLGCGPTRKEETPS